MIIFLSSVLLAPAAFCSFLGYFLAALGAHALSPSLSAQTTKSHGGGILAVISHLVFYLAGGDPRDHDGTLIGVGWAFFAFGSTGHFYFIMLSGKLGQDMASLICNLCLRVEL